MIHRFSVGGLSCVVLSDGQPEPPLEPELTEFFTPDSGVPADALRSAAEAEGRTTLTCGYNCLVVETPDGVAIVDTGLGARFLGYGPYLEPLVGKLGAGLTNAGFAPGDLAAVVFTHLHQDHSRGAVWPGELAFPAAVGYAHEAEIAYWSASPSEPGAAPHLESAREAIRLFGERLRPFSAGAGAGAEVLPGVHAVDAVGHTPGHSAYLLRSRGERLLCVGDLFYDRLQLRHPSWRTPWDLDAEASVRSRRRLLAWAADERIVVHAYHLPFPGLGRIERRGQAFAWEALRVGDSAAT
jgi:glyoxylase-like metal-dependent hydrolase (beta-lactamase superfamily II)